MAVGGDALNPMTPQKVTRPPLRYLGGVGVKRIDRQQLDGEKELMHTTDIKV